MLTPPRKKKKASNKSYKQEVDLAKDLGGYRRAFSGANRPISIYNRGTSCKGDVVVKDLQLEVEAKRTDKRSMTIKAEWLEKISVGAISHGNRPVIQLEFDNTGSLCEKKWILIEQSLFEEFMEKMREIKRQGSGD